MAKGSTETTNLGLWYERGFCDLVSLTLVYRQISVRLPKPAFFNSKENGQ